jgi:hypothetical protein
MKAIAASIVVLAGALICCASILAHDGTLIGLIGGGVLCLAGLGVFYRESLSGS